MVVAIVFPISFHPTAACMRNVRQVPGVVGRGGVDTDARHVRSSTFPRNWVRINVIRPGV